MKLYWAFLRVLFGTGCYRLLNTLVLNNDHQDGDS